MSVAMLSPKINILDESDLSITILLGFKKYICKGYLKNNIQVTGNWYLEEDTEIENTIIDSINRYGFKKVNFIGISKSCTGGFILANKLSKKFLDIQFRVFAFSAYTILDRKFYEDHDLLSMVPPSLVKQWDNARYAESLARNIDAIPLLKDKRNITVYLLYPNPSRGPEPLMAKRMQSMHNVCLIPLEVRLHGILYPFWKPVDKEATIEAFEGQIIRLPDAVYQYFSDMQSYDKYSFNLYSLTYDTDNFIENMKIFNAKFI